MEHVWDLSAADSQHLNPAELKQGKIHAPLLAEIVAVQRSFIRDRVRLGVHRGKRILSTALVSLQREMGDELVERYDEHSRARITVSAYVGDEVSTLCCECELNTRNRAFDQVRNRFVWMHNHHPEHDPVTERNRFRSCGGCLQGLAPYRSLLLATRAPHKRAGDTVATYTDANATVVFGPILHSTLLRYPFAVA